MHSIQLDRSYVYIRRYSMYRPGFKLTTNPIPSKRLMQISFGTLTMFFNFGKSKKDQVRGESIINVVVIVSSPTACYRLRYCRLG